MSRQFLVEYASGVAEAERLIADRKATSLDSLRRFGGASFNDRDNFTTNRVTLAEFADARPGNVLGLSATWACVNLLAGTIASLPLMVYRTSTAGVRTVAKDHPLYWLLHDSPNFDQTAYDFWEFMSAGIELQGNAYAEMEKRSDGFIVSLTPIRPDLVTVQRLNNGDLEYRWSLDGRQKVIAQDRMLHIRGFGGNPTGGASTLSVCRQTFGAALATDRASSRMFENGVQTTGVLSSDKVFTAEQRKQAEALLQEKFVGSVNAGRPMLLDNGLKWEQISINPEDAQMLETRRFGVEEICRIFGVPPHMIGHTENSTSWGTGLEQQTLGFQKFTLRKRLERIEQALQKQLLSRADRQNGITIEFNVEGLLRGDSAARSNFYQSALQNGWMTINEVRALENMPPVTGGDTPRMQMQNVPITQAASPKQG